VSGEPSGAVEQLDDGVRDGTGAGMCDREIGRGADRAIGALAQRAAQHLAEWRM